MKICQIVWNLNLIFFRVFLQFKKLLLSIEVKLIVLLPIHLIPQKKTPSEDARDGVLCNKVLSSNTSINDIIPNDVNTVLYNNKNEISDEIKKSLAEWAVDCNVPQSTVNRLLSVLKYKAQLTYLPKDCRTIIKINIYKGFKYKRSKTRNILPLWY